MEGRTAAMFTGTSCSHPRGIELPDGVVIANV